MITKEEFNAMPLEMRAQYIIEENLKVLFEQPKNNRVMVIHKMGDLFIELTYDGSQPSGKGLKIANIQALSREDLLKAYLTSEDIQNFLKNTDTKPLS